MEHLMIIINLFKVGNLHGLIEVNKLIEMVQNNKKKLGKMSQWNNKVHIQLQIS